MGGVHRPGWRLLLGGSGIGAWARRRLHRLRRLGRCRLVLGKRGAEEGGSSARRQRRRRMLWRAKRSSLLHANQGHLKRDLSNWKDGCPRQRPRQPELSTTFLINSARIATGSGRPCRPSGAACTARRQADFPGRDPAATAARKNAARSRAVLPCGGKKSMVFNAATDTGRFFRRFHVSRARRRRVQSGDQEGDAEIYSGASFLITMLAAAQAFADQPRPWEIGFQVPSRRSWSEITWFEHYTLWFIVPITCWCWPCSLSASSGSARASNPAPSRTSHNTLIEVVWTVGPIVIVLCYSSRCRRSSCSPAQVSHRREERQADHQGDRQPVELGL